MPLLLLQWGCGSSNNNASPTSPSAPSYTYPFQFNFGENGTGNGEFSLVAGIAVSHNALFVVDAAAGGRVEKFDLNGNFLSSWTGTPAFGQGFGIAIDKNGVVYVVDHANDIIEKFDINGNSLGSLRGDGNFGRPVRGTLGDSGQQRRAPVFSWRKKPNATASNAVPDEAARAALRFGGTWPAAPETEQFWTPTGIAVDGNRECFRGGHQQLPHPKSSTPAWPTSINSVPMVRATANSARRPLASED